MKFLNNAIELTRWQFYVLLGGTGYAFGNILAKSVAALGG